MTIVERATPGRVSWVDLQTPDPEKARAFYGALFGWTFAGGDEAAGFYTMASLGGRKVAGMVPLRPGSPYSPMWSVYVASAAVDALAPRVGDAGGKVLLAPLDVRDLGRLSFFSEPTGALFGSWQAKQHFGAEVIDEVGAMCWHELYSNDVNVARAFFAKALGLEDKHLDLPGVDYGTLHVPNDRRASFGTMQIPKEHPKQPSHFNTYFAVADVDASVAKAQELGGEVISPPFDTPFGRLAFLADPCGAAFNVMKPVKLPGE